MASVSPVYFRGHVDPPNLAELIAHSYRRHSAQLRALRPLAFPAAWDSRIEGWIGPVKNQAQCGCMPGTDEVLTENGWTRWKDYDWSTPLGTMNQQSGHLEFQQPLQRHVYDYDGPLYYSENRCIDFALTPNHRLYVRKWNQPKRTLDDHFQFVEASKLGWYVGLPHATTGWLGTELKKLGIGNRVYNGDDLLALIALVVSDGWAGGVEKTKNTVSFCCFRDDRIEMVRGLAFKLGFDEQVSREGVWAITDGALAEWFRQNVYTGDVFRSPFKRVPRLVKEASQRQIEHFLKFFGDQHVQEEGTRRFYSSSRLLIDDLQELLLRIGRRGTIEERPERVATFGGREIASNGPDLTLTERRTDRLCIDRKRHLRQDHYRGQVYCATVPNSTLVTRRNGSILISGNSCWDFSGTFVVEVAYNKSGVGGGAGTFILSDEYTLDCGRNGGCNGDNNTTVLDWAKTTGLPLSSVYGSYSAGSGRVGRCGYTSDMQLYKITDWGYASASGDQGVAATSDIKTAIMSYGCVGCAIAADDAFANWGSSNASMSSPFRGSGSTGIDHDVALVGWDDSTGSWILRNSWGTSWGVGGYMAISFGANLVGTQAVWAYLTAPTPPIPPIPPTPPPDPNHPTPYF